MHINRRTFALSVAALGLSGCTSAVASGPARAKAVTSDLRPVSNGAYNAWVRNFYPCAKSKGISASTLRKAFRNTGYLPGVVKRDRNQTEFKRTLEDYLSITTSDEPVSKGHAAFARHRRILNTLESKYGVDAKIIGGI